MQSIIPRHVCNFCTVGRGILLIKYKRHFFILTITHRPRRSTLFPYTTLFRSDPRQQEPYDQYHENSHAKHWDYHKTPLIGRQPTDRKSGSAGMPRPISYAVLCLKKKIAAMVSQTLRWLGFPP